MIIGAMGAQPVSVEPLVTLAGASAAMIRRDLADLQGHGLLRRVHGGTVSAASARVVLAATGDKLTRTSAFRFGVVGDLDDLVTTRDAPPEMLDEFVTAGVSVHLA